jgi:Fe-S cluster assembly iron-binding protein IscA
MKQIHVIPTRVEGSFMLTVTAAAGEHLAQVLGDTQEDVAIRFVLAGQNLEPKLDTPRSGDTTFDHNGRTILILDEGVSQMLAGQTLDMQETHEGPRLTLS